MKIAFAHLRKRVRLVDVDELRWDRGQATPAYFRRRATLNVLSH
jgi:hypothetical protein